jgi:hypothetical protein
LQQWRQPARGTRIASASRAANSLLVNMEASFNVRAVREGLGLGFAGPALQCPGGLLTSGRCTLGWSCAGRNAWLEQIFQTGRHCRRIVPIPSEEPVSEGGQENGDVPVTPIA